MKRRPRGGWWPCGSWGESWWGVLTGRLSDSVWPRGAEPASAISEVLVQSLEFTVRPLTLVIHIGHMACAPHTVTTGRTPPTGGPSQGFGKWQNSIDCFKSTTKLARQEGQPRSSNRKSGFIQWFSVQTYSQQVTSQENGNVGGSGFSESVFVPGVTGP